jgi:hypothetical protein
MFPLGAIAQSGGLGAGVGVGAGAQAGTSSNQGSAGLGTGVGIGAGTEAGTAGSVNEDRRSGSASGAVRGDVDTRSSVRGSTRSDSDRHNRPEKRTPEQFGAGTSMSGAATAGAAGDAPGTARD